MLSNGLSWPRFIQKFSTPLHLCVFALICYFPVYAN